MFFIYLSRFYANIFNLIINVQVLKETYRRLYNNYGLTGARVDLILALGHVEALLKGYFQF